MSKHQKSWSVQEKQEIVEFYRQHNMSEAVRKFGVSNVSIYKWEKVIEESGISGFTDKSISKGNSEVNKLKRENDRLMRLIAEKEVIISIQNDLLKKKR
ncbi:MAG: helix-turn-helix domain-containing protein [Cytophagaceae bacterium]|nr:helix-turn-helix domain-containing protein [Cytophagaceae bacterium]